MIRSIPQRTMRDVWDERRGLYGRSIPPSPTGRCSTSIPSRTTMRDWYDKGNIRRKYSNQINTHKTSGTSGALYRKGKLKFQNIQGQPRNIYRAGGCQGTIYTKRKSKGNMSRTKDALNPPNLNLDETIDEIEEKIFETGGKTYVVVELCLEKVTNVSYDPTKEKLVVQANKNYIIPLKLKNVNTRTLEWYYNNGVIEISFKTNDNKTGCDILTPKTYKQIKEE